MDAARQRRLQAETLKYAARGDYNAMAFWADRFLEYGFTYRAVGDRGKSEAANAKDYTSALALVADFITDQLDLATHARIVDLGVGTGAHLRMLHALGYHNLVGVDITPTFRCELTAALGNGFSFRQADIGTDVCMPAHTDVILLTDVLQHLVHPAKFRFCLERNVHEALYGGGVVIFTERFENVAYSYYEVMREIDVYHSLLAPTDILMQATPYRDKFITAWRL